MIHLAHTTHKTTIIAGDNGVSKFMGPTEMAKTDHKRRQIRIELSGFSALYTGPTDTLWFAIGDFLNFFLIKQKKN